MGRYRNRQARKAKAADDRLHGRHAQPPRRYRGGSWGGFGGDSDGWLPFDVDDFADVIGDLVEALFKIFD